MAVVEGSSIRLSEKAQRAMPRRPVAVIPCFSMTFNLLENPNVSSEPSIITGLRKFPVDERFPSADFHHRNILPLQHRNVSDKKSRTHERLAKLTVS